MKNEIVAWVLLCIAIFAFYYLNALSAVILIIVSMGMMYMPVESNMEYDSMDEGIIYGAPNDYKPYIIDSNYEDYEMYK